MASAQETKEETEFDVAYIELHKVVLKLRANLFDGFYAVGVAPYNHTKEISERLTAEGVGNITDYIQDLQRTQSYLMELLSGLTKRDPRLAVSWLPEGSRK